MASIGGVSGSSGTSSLYNSANIISGLASGLDTEGMIESLVKSYQNKIQTLNNKATKLQWKQDAYRSIISKMTGFSSKYTSYTSSTNLMSAAFFNSAVKVAPQGENGKYVTASGRTDSNVVLNSVSQLATSARYVTKGDKLVADTENHVTASKGMGMMDPVDLSRLQGSLTLNYGSKSVSISFDEVSDYAALSGDTNKADQLKALIEDKLKDEKITLSSGEAASAYDRIKVDVAADGTISFSDKSTAGNSVYISSASDAVKSTLGIGDLDDADNRVKSFQVTDRTSLTKQVDAYEYLSGKSININVDGTTKSIMMPQITKSSDGKYTFTMPSTVKDNFGNVSYVYDTSKLDKSKYTVTKQGEVRKEVSEDAAADTYTELLNNSVKAAFGDKLTVSNQGKDGTLKLDFEVQDGSNLLINTSVGETLGIGRTATNYLNTSKSLKDLMGEEAWEGLTAATDADGNKITDSKTGKELYDFTLNGVLIGRYSKDSKLSDIMSDINNNSEAGVKVSYSKTTRQFVFTSKETGSQSKIEMGNGLASAIFGSTESNAPAPKFADAYGLPSWADKVVFDFDGDRITLNNLKENSSIEDIAQRLNTAFGNAERVASYNKYTGQLEIKDENGAAVNFKAYYDDEDLGRYNLSFKEEFAPKVSYTPGQDAKFKVTVDGVEKELTRGSNSVDIDGLTINFKDTFNEADGGPVTFQINTDADKIVDAVKNMITDYNDMMAEIRKAYAVMPYQDSTGAFKSYEPLTEEERSTMSESSIQAYEERAKQGILFGDSNLRTLYERMRDIFQVGGADGAMLQKIGITSSFSSSDNSTTLVLDENKLRAALEEDPDAVANLFTRSGESGTSTNGIMQGMKNQLDRYAGLTGAVKGILVQQSGTPLNSLSLLDNQWQKEIDNLGTQIEKWQDKLEKQVDRYTSMFSRLEMLINQMNSQSSTLAGLMGG